MRIPLLVATLTGICLLAPGPAAAETTVEKARLVFVNGPRIVAIDADGGNRQPISFRAKSLDEYDDQYDTAPRISPDGSKVLFLRELDTDSAGEITKVMVASMDGTATTAVTDSERLVPEGMRHTPQVWLKSAAWNHDGSRIYFSVESSRFWWKRSKRISTIRSIRPDGTNMKTIARSKWITKRGKGFTGGGIFEDLDASGDGKKLLVTKDIGPGDRNDLFVIQAGTGKSKRLVKSASQGRWSPDGTSILYLSHRDKTGEQCYEGGCAFQEKIYTAKSNGSGQSRLLPRMQAGTVLGADWAPDGSRIAFGSDRNQPGLLGFSSEIYSVKTDGSCISWLTNGSPESYDPNWSPASGPDSDPGVCGPSEREVVIDPLPPAHPIVDEKPAKWPTLWPGPVYKDSVLAYPDPDGSNLSYFDCARFLRRDCNKGTYLDLSSGEVCSAWAFSDALDKGRYRGMLIRRGAVLTMPVFDSDYRVATLFTGGQAIQMTIVSFFDRKPTNLGEYVKLVDSLRPVGHDELAGQDLQTPVFDRNIVNRSVAISNAVKKAGSVRKYVNGRNGPGAKTVRAYLRFHQDFKKLGPFKTVPCRTGS